MTKDDYTRCASLEFHLVRIAATLVGDGAGNEIGLNAEYERGIAELIARACGHPDSEIAGIRFDIAAEARQNS